MEVRLQNIGKPQTYPLYFEVVNKRGHILAIIEIPNKIENVKEAREQAYIIASQMHLRKR